MVTVIAILTSHNRKAGTLKSLACLAASAERAGIAPMAVLVDDGSTDGTAEAVRESYPWVRVIEGDGSLFWNRGMHRAQDAAMAEPGYDHLLWLNDDTNLLPDALARLLATAAEVEQRHGRAGIVIGTTADAASGRPTYSGQARTSGWKPFAFRMVLASERALPCDTMNGNVVLLPAPVAKAVGNLDPAFEHSGGDIDYGLRARRLGIPLYVAAGIVGHCKLNPSAGIFNDVSLPFAQRWKHLNSRKGLPVGTWLPLTRRHGGWLWPLHFSWPYVKVLASSLQPLRRKR